MPFCVCAKPWLSWCGTACVSGYMSLYALSFTRLCLRVCPSPTWLNTCVTLCNVLMLECVSRLKAISSLVSISILYSFYLQPSETEGLFFFVSQLTQQLSDLTLPLHFHSSLTLYCLTRLSSDIYSRIRCWRCGASGMSCCLRGHQMGSRSVSR